LNNRAGASRTHPPWAPSWTSLAASLQPSGEHERRCSNRRLARHYVVRRHAEYGVLRERGKGEGRAHSQK
jgi:hypothetical protein